MEATITHHLTIDVLGQINMKEIVVVFSPQIQVY